MATISTLSTPIATPMVGKDGMIDPVWNEFFVRFMITAGIKVSIDDLETDTTSLQTQIDAIDVEAVGSIDMTDSDSNGSATLAKLYDGNRTSNGVAYTLSGTDKYLEYKFGMKSYVDRISLWVADANARIYIAYSDDGSAWTYLSAESDHTLDSEGRLVNATSQSNAATDYFQLAAGQNNALFPNNISALYIRLYMTGTYSTTVYEFIPSRILIAEMAAIENLAVLSATFGPVGGYDDITDKPESLSDIDAAEGAKFAGIATGADVSPGLPSDENLVGYWSIDESSGTVIKDSSGRGNDGILDSGTFGTGVSGNCIDLDYTADNHIEIADNVELDFGTGDFSISCWAKINAFQSQGSAYNCILYRGTLSATPGCQYGFVFTTVGSVRFIVGDADFQATGLDDLTDNLWHHIVGVRESGITKIYVDTVKGTDSTSALDVDGSEDFIIGGNDGSDRYLDGSVDEVRLYDKALTANEVKALYLNPGGMKAPIPGADITADAAVIGTMQAQIDGKVIAWFQASASDPADAWTTDTIRDTHVNDTWYRTDTKLLYWYNSSYVWTLVEDQKALDAYSDASDAQDTADGKRRVFVATPTVPYDVGDLWDTGDGIARCSTAKTAAQAYSSGDWAVAATDDAFLASGYTTIVGDVISVFSATISIVADENDMLDWIENSTTEVATLTPSTTYTPTTLAAHIQTKMRAEGDADTTVAYNSTTKKITIANSTLTTLSLLWNTGTNADENCGNALGFSIAADDTGALTYAADTKAALRVLIGDLS